MDHKCDDSDDCDDDDDSNDDDSGDDDYNNRDDSNNTDDDDCTVGIVFAANIAIVSGPFIVTVGMKTT